MMGTGRLEEAWEKRRSNGGIRSEGWTRRDRSWSGGSFKSVKKKKKRRGTKKCPARWKCQGRHNSQQQPDGDSGGDEQAGDRSELS